MQALMAQGHQWTKGLGPVRLSWVAEKRGPGQLERADQLSGKRKLAT